MEAAKLYNNDVGQTTLRESAVAEIVPNSQPILPQGTPLPICYSRGASVCGGERRCPMSLWRLLWKHRGSAVHEPFAIECNEEINQRVDVIMGDVKRTNLRVEVRIPDATPFVEQHDVSQGRQRPVVHVRRVPVDVAQRRRLEGASISRLSRDRRAAFVRVPARRRVPAKSEIVKRTIGQVRTVMATAALCIAGEKVPSAPGGRRERTSITSLPAIPRRVTAHPSALVIGK